MKPALALEDAQARLLALAAPLAIERTDVAGCLGRFLAEPLTARRTQPAADVSAMDGYAVRAEDVAGPWRVVGESAAGHPYNGQVGPDHAVRISTGALLPDGAGAVIVQEDVARDGDKVTLTGEGPDKPARHVRPCGSDFATGKDLLPAGTWLGPAQLALALTAGHRLLPVRRTPRITIIDSGDELAADPEQCAVHQIPASNGAMLTALCAAVPTRITRAGPAPDELGALVAALEAAEGSDVIVTTGGASVGDHDLIRPALEAWGATLDFWRVAIKPGKPLLVARRGNTIVLGLPGNPASSFVTAYLFLLPLLRALLGASAPVPAPLFLPATSALPAGGNRREFLRARLGPHGATPLTAQDSGALAALAGAHALIDRPAGAVPVTAGTMVPVYLLENGGIA